MRRPSPVLSSFTMEDVTRYLESGSYPDSANELLQLALRQFASLWEAGLVNLYAVGHLSNLTRIDVIPSRHGDDVISFRLVPERDPRTVRSEIRAARAASKAPLSATVAETTAKNKAAKKKAAAK